MLRGRALRIQKHVTNRRIPITKKLSPHSKNLSESRVFIQKLPVRCFIVVSLAINDEISIVKKLDLFWHFDESLKSCLGNKILWSLVKLMMDF
jgi:hypothetical protein